MRFKDKDSEEVVLLRSWLVLIRYRLAEISTNRLFIPNFELDRVIQMMDREIESWHEEDE